MISLRPHQTRAVDACRGEFEAGARSVLLVAPTAFGKTAAASVLIHRSVAAGNRVLFAVHRKEIVRDTVRRLRAVGLRVGTIMAGEAADPSAPTQVATIQTVDARGLGDFHPDFVVTDEAHHAAASTYRALYETARPQWHLGITATPMRADGAGLGDAFERMVVGATVAELTPEYLAPCDAIVAPSSQRGSIAMDEHQAVERYCGEQPTLVFVQTVERARALAERTPDAAAIYGDMRDEDRTRALDAFRVGAIRTLYNVFVLTEGTDLPMASRVVLGRTFGHAGTYLQAVGRVLRTDPANPSKRALIVDLGDNVRTHGMPADEREFSLGDEPIRAKATAPRLCPTCGAVRRSASGSASGSAEATACWRCETPYPAPKAVTVRADALVAFDGDTSYSATKQDYFDRMFVQSAAKGYAPGWAAHRFRARFGHWPTGYQVSPASAAMAGHARAMRVA